MARIRPFSAFRYDLSRARGGDVVTQPYDRITADMRQRYLAASPFNLVRVILGEKRDDDDEQHNVYTRAAQFLKDWIQRGVLKADPEPGIYLYSQTFKAPDTGQAFTRHGFIALGALEDYQNKVVYRHELTLSGPKIDRQNLLRATRTHFGQIFMLYSDPAQTVEAELQARATNPVFESTDEYGTVHRMFRETDHGVIARLEQHMATRPLIIADGHHRYETALQWRNEQTANAPHRADHPWDWVMMTFVNLDAPGLVVLPTHRIVHGLPGWNAAAAATKLQQYFDTVATEEKPVPAAWPRLRARLAAAAGAGPVLAVALAGQLHVLLLRPKPGLDLAGLLPDLLPEQRSLDVVLLHQFALNLALGLTPEMVRAEQNLRYGKDGAEALQSIEAGAGQAAFLLNPVSAAKVRDIALAGGVMPQKSTDFFPKLLTGLTMYRVD